MCALAVGRGTSSAKGSSGWDCGRHTLPCPASHASLLPLLYRFVIETPLRHPLPAGPTRAGANLGGAAAGQLQLDAANRPPLGHPRQQQQQQQLQAPHWQQPVAPAAHPLAAHPPGIQRRAAAGQPASAPAAGPLSSAPRQQLAGVGAAAATGDPSSTCVWVGV